MKRNVVMRKLPSVNALLKAPSCAPLVERHGLPLVTFAVRDVLARMRREATGRFTVPPVDIILRDVGARVTGLAEPSLKPVLNATGVILHTNLGRAPLGEGLIADIARVCSSYSNLEFDLRTGRRGHRTAHVAGLIRYLTGADDALVVNNNAAAIVLVLNTFARGREVIISRGELIEIGGAFRIPEIMRASGAKMVEVGTTNRTRVSDYEKAISPRTALIFKAHKSNYAIKGFTEEVAVERLAALARKHDLPMVYDIGSGLLRKPPHLKLEREPDVQSAIADKADLVTFSCDKLLGGPQAGVVAGQAALVAKLANAPLMRALRVGKLTLAALSSACRHYLSNEKLLSQNPTFAMLSQPAAMVKKRAAALARELKAAKVAAETADSKAQVGGGSLPELELASFALHVKAPDGPSKQKEQFAEKLFRSLLRADTPVLGVLREGRFLLDVFTVSDRDIPALAQAVAAALRQE